MKILVVEDDPEVGETVSMAFSIRWPQCMVRIEDSGGGAIKAVSQENFALVILDINLPDLNGFAVLESIRRVSQVPVIMLTVRASESDKVRGLEMGADDYVPKPFSPFELLARASAVLRRSRGSEPKQVQGMLQAGPIKIDLQTAEVFVHDRPVKLSPTEFKVLSLLARNAGKIVPREVLIKQIWGIVPDANDAYLIKLHIQHLRRKLGDTGTQSKLIITVRGFGYKVPA